MMDRRDFIKLCSIAGLGVAATGLPGTANTAHAADGRFYVFVHAVGGWDISMLMDPKGNAPNSQNNVVNTYYSEGEILTAGNIPYAPNFTGAGNPADPNGINNVFFNRFFQDMTVFNGIDAETNGHDSGQRNTWSGRLTQGTPAFAALLAAAKAGDLPMAFLTNGGYDTTGGYIAPTRIGNTNALQALIQPNRLNPTDENSALYHTEETMARINEARQARLQELQEIQNLPRIDNALSLLYTSRLGMGDLKKINDFLPDDLGQGLARQANIALAAYAAGLTQCVNISTGGFDTHGNNEVAQTTRQGVLLQGVMDLFDRAEELNIADQLVVMIGSDFSRTFRINEGNGKDHWSVASTMLISSQIPGNRVIGATNDAGIAEKVNLSTLQVDPGGDTLKHGHIHKWLRKFTGIQDDQAVKLFPLNAEGEIELM
jgi:hypothetical protein